jgi:hypothetical protein
MTATAHALVGGAIAAAVPDPVLGLSLSFASHPFLDMIPHWDLGLGWRLKNKFTLFLESSLDLLVGILLAYLIFGKAVNPVYFLACIFASEIWDILMMPYLLLAWKFPPFSTVYKFQHGIQSNVRLPWGILTQAATVYATVLLLRFAHLALATY